MSRMHCVRVSVFVFTSPYVSVCKGCCYKPEFNTDECEFSVFSRFP